MAIANVQDNTNNIAGAGTTIVQDTSLNTTTGNHIVVTVNNWDSDSNAGVITGCTDTASNSYVKAIGVYRSGTTQMRAEVWYAENITGNAANIVTATFTGTVSFARIVVCEWSGVAISSSLDDTSSATQSSTSHTTGDATASEDGCLMVGCYAADNAVNLTVGAGYTALGPTSERRFSEYKILGVAAAYAATLTSQNSTTSIFVGAIFIPVAVAGTNIEVNVGDAWKAVTKVEINVGDVWKDVSAIEVNVGDVWKSVF